MEETHHGGFLGKMAGGTGASMYWQRRGKEAEEAGAGLGRAERRAGREAQGSSLVCVPGGESPRPSTLQARDAGSNVSTP